MLRCTRRGKYLHLKFNCKGMLLKNLSIRAFTKAKIGKIDVMCMSTVYLNSPPFKNDPQIVRT